MRERSERTFEPFPKVLGIYSSNSEDRTGTGATQRSSRQQIYWYVLQISEEKFEMQPLNANHVPSGVIKHLDLAEFSKLTPEPSYYQNITLPVLQSLRGKIERGEKYFEKGLLSAAEKEFLKALKIDELNVRANFGLGEVYAEQHEYEKIRHVVGVLLGLDETFREEHRKRFNSLGVSLRKNGMVDEAINYYSKALEYNEEDENLHFNMARAYFEKMEYVQCEKHLKRALEISPDFREARLFQAYLERQAPHKFEGKK